MLQRSLMFIALGVLASGSAYAQLTSGHASEQGDTRYNACQQTIGKAQSVAQQHQFWVQRQKKVSTRVELVDVRNDGSDCNRCESSQIYGNPTQWTCVVRWRLTTD